MLTLFAKLLKALNSNDSPAQLCLAVVFALFLGITPLWSVYNLFWLFLLLVIRVNLSLFLLSWGLFTVIAYLIDPLSNQLGLWLLQQESLKAMWTTMYNSSVWRVLAFNNTLVLGSFALCVLLAVPVFIAVYIIVTRYRRHLLTRIKNSRLNLWIKSSRLVSIYQSLNE